MASPVLSGLLGQQSQQLSQRLVLPVIQCFTCISSGLHSSIGGLFSPATGQSWAQLGRRCSKGGRASPGAVCCLGS